MAAYSMSLPSQSTDLQHRQHGNDARQQRLADLSGAMAVARLSHQVKELELQKRKQEKLARPTFAPINAIIDAGMLVSSLEHVKQWTGDGGVNITVPLTVLHELDRLKKGSDAINIKTREVIRYLDRRTKSPPARINESKPLGSLRTQGQEEMFADWHDCEKMIREDEVEPLSKEEIPRYARGIVNCILYQRSRGHEISLITEDEALIPFLEKWGIKKMAGVDVDSASSIALEKYRQDLKAYEARKRDSDRKPSAKPKSLWAPAT